MALLKVGSITEPLDAKASNCKGGTSMKPYPDFIKCALRAVRAKAAALPSFDGPNGCIRFLFRPLCEEAASWYGREFVENDPAEYEETYTIAPGGSHTVIEDGQTVNCFGFSELKIAACSRNRSKHGIRLSYSAFNAQNPDIVPENGFANYRGAVCYTIVHKITTSNGVVLELDWARFYCSVSGAHNDVDDENAACEAYKALLEAFRDDGNYRVI